MKTPLFGCLKIIIMLLIIAFNAYSQSVAIPSNNISSDYASNSLNPSQSESSLQNDITFYTSFKQLIKRFGGNSLLDDEEQQLLQLINQYRIDNGLSILIEDINLDHSSQWLSIDMATQDYVNSIDSLGRNYSQRMKAFGYSGSAIAENVAAGRAHAIGIFNLWKQSKSNLNILRESARSIGISRAYNPNSTYKWYWTTDFGN